MIFMSQCLIEQQSLWKKLLKKLSHHQKFSRCPQKIDLRSKYLNLRKKQYFNIDKNFFNPLIKLLRKKNQKKFKNSLVLSI